MAKFSITMPDEMGNYIQSAMKTRQFENTSEYFRHLVRQDQERESKIAELRNMLDKAGNIYFYRAALNAGRFFTLAASGGFQHGGFRGISKRNLVKIRPPVLRLLFLHGLS